MRALIAALMLAAGATIVGCQPADEGGDEAAPATEEAAPAAEEEAAPAEGSDG